jgi:hypothetical protein
MPDITVRLDKTYGKICYDAAETAAGLTASRGDQS